MAVTRTVQDVAYRALRLLHVIRQDETPQTADTNTALSVLQDMMASWAMDGLIIPTVTLENFTLVVGQTTYTIGEDGTPTLDTVRPETILGAYIVDDADYTHAVEIIKEADYMAIIDKTLTNRPESVWISYESPNVTLYMYPVPDTAEEFYFWSDKPFLEPTSLSQDIFVTLQIPRSYHKALADNLAVELAPEYEAQINPLTMNAAIKGKAALISASANRRVNPTKLDIAMPRRRAYSLVDFFAGR
jgi:hypothetical protein